jgi:hypothetical protein
MIDLNTNPQALAAVRTASTIVEVAQSYEVVDATMFSEAGNELRNITTRKKEIDTLRASLKAPVLEAGRRIDDFFRGPIDMLANAEKIIKDKMLTFQRAEEKRRQEAEAAARRQAEEAARKAREEAEALAAEQRRQAEEAAKAGDVSRAAEAAAEAENTLAAAEVQIEAQTSAAIAAPVAQAPRAAGIGIRENWQAEVTDLHALIRAAAENPTAFAMYLQPNDQALRATAKATKGATKIPGVRIYDAGTVSARSIGR